MLTLMIDKPGLIIRITGMKEIRSPANIDITKVNINNVLSSLKRDGIVDFKIVEDGVTLKPSKRIKRVIEIPEESKIEEKNVVEKVLEDFKQNNLESKLEVIESLIRNILTSPVKETVIYKEGSSSEVKSKTKTEEEFDLEFIPEINIGDMKAKKPKIGSITRDDNLDAIVSSLRNIGGKT